MTEDQMTPEAPAAETNEKVNPQPETPVEAAPAAVEPEAAAPAPEAPAAEDPAAAEREQEARAERERQIAGVSATLAALEMLAAQAQLLPKQAEFAKRKAEWAAAEVALPDEYKEKAAGYIALCEEKLAKETAAAASAGPELEAVADELEKLAEQEDIEPFRKARAALEKRRDAALASAVAGDDRVVAATARIRPLLKKLGARLARHYQALDLARWESYTLKLDMVRELEAMSAAGEEELAAVARRLREIRQAWRDLGAVPHEKQHELGPRYYALTTALQHRVDGHFRTLRSEQSTAEQAKQKLCEAVEAIADSTEWNATAERIKALQAEWKNAGNAGRAADTALYRRFRTACDRFFNARAAYWQERRAQVGAALADKGALCTAAEGLGALPRAEALAKARELRAQFQAMPRGGKAEIEINNRFNAAMDVFFGGLRAADAAAKGRHQEVIDSLNLSGPFDPAAAETALRSARAAWAELPPLRREERARVENRFRSACAALEKRIESARSRRMEEKSGEFPAAMRFAASCVAAARRGEPVPEVTLDLTAFEKLGAAVTDLVAEGGKVPEGMEKALARNTREFRSLIEEWEALLAKPAESAPRDLAAELTMAIAGNFAAADFHPETARTPAELRRKLLAVGVIDPEAVEELLPRAEALLAAAK